MKLRMEGNVNISKGCTNIIEKNCKEPDICFWQLYFVRFTHEMDWHRIIKCMWKRGNLVWLGQNKDIFMKCSHY